MHRKQQHIGTIRAGGINYNSQMPSRHPNVQMQGPGDNYSDQIEQYHQLHSIMQQHQSAIHTYETNQKTMDNSPTKIHHLQESKMGVNTQKKNHKVIRKSVRNKEPQNLNYGQQNQNQFPKSIDRVSGLKQVPQNQIQINVDHGMKQNQVHESKMFANNVIKFQSTSTKSNGAKKIRVAGHEIKNQKDLVYIKQKQHITNNNSLINMEKMQMSQAVAESGQQMLIQHEVASQLNSLNHAKFQGHRKNLLSSNCGSGTNLKTMPNSKMGNNQGYMTQNGAQGQYTQQRRKQSIQNFKKVGIDPHPQINTQELISNSQGIMISQSKTTKNSNYYPIESNGLTLQMKNSAATQKTNGTTTNQAMVSNLKLKSQKMANNQKQEFNCLINNQMKVNDYEDIHENNSYHTQNKQISGSRIVSAGNSKNKNNQVMINEANHSGQTNSHPINTTNPSQFRMRQDGNTNVQNSLENLNNQKQSNEILNYQNFDVNQKVLTSFHNTQGINIQQIMLETEGTFCSDSADDKKIGAINSQKKMNQTDKQMDARQPAGTINMGHKNMIGPYIIQNNKQLAQQVVQGIPNMKFYNQIGSSSATNRAKKAFTFDIDSNQKNIKQAKNKGQSAVAFANKLKVPTNINKNGQNLGQANFIQQNKKMPIQNKSKLKTQMNLTGPLPKNILSPKTTINKSQGKTKHSQYFNNEQEVVLQNHQQHYIVPQKIGNDPQNFNNMGQMTPQNNHGDLQLFYQNSNMGSNHQPPINQHQHQNYSVNLNGMGPGGHQHHETASPTNNQPQITTSTQGCNTVININIDSNTFRRLNNETHSKNETDSSALKHYSSSAKNQIQNQSSAQPKQNSKTRQTSSKMKRNDSISSNKSKKLGQNRRSNSGSQMRQQQKQATYQHISQISGLKGFNQPATTNFVKNSSPKSNSDIIMNNIALINQKLHQQEAVNYSGTGQNLQININRVNEKTQGSTLKKNSKSKTKKETPLIDPKVGAPQMFSLNGHLFNQTQKLAVSSNPQSISGLQSDAPTMYSIIPKKQGDGDNFSGFKNKNKTQKLTLKKITKNKKSDNTNSIMDSARTPGKSVGSSHHMAQHLYQNQPQSQFYGNQNNRDQDVMYDQLLNMENAIQQNQIKLRNELLQMQDSLKNKSRGIKNQSMEKMSNSQIMQQENIEEFSTIKNQFDDQTDENISKNYQFAPQINMLHIEKNRTGKSSKIQQRDYQTQALPLKGQSKKNQASYVASLNKKSNNVSGLQMMNMPPQQPRPNRSTGNSVQGRQIKNPKMNIEDINIEIDSMSQLSQNLLFQDQNQALNYISTKKSVSTKNQFNQQKIQTQNVQFLLREAKREMVVDSNSVDNEILVGGDDLSHNKLNPQKSSRFNFAGTQNLQIGNQPNNFNFVHAPKGFTPQNNQQQINDFEIKEFHSQGTCGSSSTFGLSQINKKKQIIKQPHQEINYNNQQQKNQQQSKSAPGKSNIGAASKNLSINTSPHKNKRIAENQINNQNQFAIAPEGKTAPFQQKQMKLNAQFPKKHDQLSQPAIATELYDSNPYPNGGNNSSMTGTLPSQVSDYNTYGGFNQGFRNSNLPPSGSHVQMESDPENLLIIDSKISEIEAHDITNNSGFPVQIQKENSADKPQQFPISQALELPKNNDEELTLPISGAKVLKHYLKRPGITEYEKSEVLDYKQIYYLGLGAEKHKGTKFQDFNFGYDDDRGDYNVILKDHLAFRFEIIDFLGKGSFGQAIKCYDHKTHEIVAVKIIRNKKKFQHQAGVELKILLHLKENDPDDTNNIIRIKDYTNFRKHLLISFELFSINLYEFIKNNNFEGVSLSLIRRFAIQLLQALKYLREEDLIHCDLKPENILLKSPDKSGIKVIDFGSSCFSNQRIYTYIQSRFYRAPEIILGVPYTAAIDMWSFGCILTELFTGIPIFPGESEQEQLSMIIQVLGVPDDKTLEQASRKKIFFDEETNKPNLTSNSQGELRLPMSRPLEQVLMSQSESFQDFIKQCLEWNPEKRITPFDALMHDWIVEGLPPQVLVHHKKMLGIYESETEEEEVMNEHSQLQDGDSVINDDSQQQIQIDTSQYDHMNDLIDKQDLSCSIMQGFDDVEISHDMEMSSRQNQYSENRPSDQLHIDFYGNQGSNPGKGINRAQMIAAQSRYSVENNQNNMNIM